MTNFARRTTSLAAAVVACLAATAAPASAKTTTLHFLQKGIASTFTDANGNPVTPPGPTTAPNVGERFTATDDDYVGNHKHHAKKATASDHIVCTFIDTMGTATCDGQIAIGGALLLAQHVTVNFAQNIVVPINGGTGAYKHATGTATSVSIGNSSNSDFTVKITT